MSHQNYSPSLSLDSGRHHWLWIWSGAALAAAVIAVVILANAEPEDDYIAAPKLDMHSLGAQEWSDFSELSHQSLESEAAELSEVKDVPEEVVDPFHIKGRITRNQTLFIALKNHDLDIGDIHQVIASLDGVLDFRRTRPGDTYEVELDVDHRILKFVYEVSPEDISVSRREGNGYVGEKLAIDKKVERRLLRGTLSSSLYQSFEDLGESGELATHFMHLFKYDMDFSTESQRGDEFSMLVEKIMLNGKFYRYGRVWAATYESALNGRRLEAYYFDDGKEDYAGYYDSKGRALKRTFLKTPLVGCTMTSPYNLKRMHPILKRVRPHYGIDWACPTGTPVMAFADGVVTFADWKGGNGNLLVIEHRHGYTSLYAHLYGFARGIKKGVHVKQGQVVALLGNTGISTGPHLHFGVKIYGKYVDPAKIDTRHALTLSGSRLAAFYETRNELRYALNGSSVPAGDAVAENAMAVPDDGVSASSGE